MLKEHRISRKNPNTNTWENITVYEYTLFAFSTQKGIFTLTGTSSDWIDTFKNLGTGEFHDWPRSHIKKWHEQGKITPVQEATRIDWQENQRRPPKGRPQSKVMRK